MNKTKRRWRFRTLILLLVIGTGCYTAWALLRPLPPLLPSSYSKLVQKQAVPSKLSWPETGQSAVGIVGSNILETHGTQTPVPIASTAKVITALVVLRNKPMVPGQPGPAITLSANDAALYEFYSAQHGSVIPAQAGEQISQYQMLEAIMLPSANNMADSLAIWAYGSMGAYGEAANKFLKEQGLTSTHVGTDASGFSPTTTSTAQDLVRLGELAMQNPVLAQIVGQTTAQGIPLAGTVSNVNFLLGSDNIVGVKTGNTDEAGGVFIAAARLAVNGKPVTFVTALAGAPSLFAALKFSEPLIHSAQTNFSPVTLLKAGTLVGRYNQPWGNTIPVVTGNDLSTTTWNGSTVTARISLRPASLSAKQSLSAGIVTAPATPFASPQSISLNLNQKPSTPTIWWKLVHPTQK